MIRGPGKIFCAVVLLCALGAAGAQANPDVWVKVATTFRFEDGKITDIVFDWRFDEFFSSRTIKAYDADQNGFLEPNEVERLREGAFDPLKKFNYYVHIWIDGEKRENLKIRDFDASIHGGNLVYRFTVAVTPPADPNAVAIVASLFDKDIFVDFRFVKKNFLLVEGEMRPDCTFRVARGKGAQYRHPQPVILKCGGSK